MSGRYLLDTNIVIAIMNGESLPLSRLPGTIVSIPLPVIGELNYGARNSARATENLVRVEQFVAGISILLPDLNTATWYGQVRHALRLRGRPLPENDVWIAAMARQHDLTLVSRDAHFKEVDDLELETW